MARIAIINGSTVVNVIEMESAEKAQEFTGLLAVISETAGLGDTYDPETDEFTTPEYEPVELPEPIAEPEPTE